MRSENSSPAGGKSPWRWLFLAAAILCALVLVGYGVLALIAYLSIADLTADLGAASIGIIGGADGPTAIFVSGVPGGLGRSAAMAAVLLVISLLGFRRLSK